ncbi:MAG: endonuclease/exonuclease/phosphatase family protein [Deltaproteobacteria bacterium]|nr:endonuclease/exonuclease/phosphatase family protein [Deltaproteobacteria bacterium]
MDLADHCARRARSATLQLLTLSLLLLQGCDDGVRGAFSVLTYNIAGLPEGVSSSNPEKNTPLISPHLDAFDLVLVQEDFFYHEQLIADVSLPYRSTPGRPQFGRLIGDGLNRLARLRFDEVIRQPWTRCNGTTGDGNDCLASKGFSRARTQLAANMTVDVYNLHMDAGGASEDIAARQAQVEQLLAEIAAQSAGHALIVAGDTNLHFNRTGDDQALRRLFEGAGLEDACGALACGDQRIDRVLWRSGPSLRIEPRRWWIPEDFVDAAQQPLSDHLPVAVELSFRAE